MFRALLLLCRDILRHPLPFASDKVRHLHVTRWVGVSLPDLQTPVCWCVPVPSTQTTLHFQGKHTDTRKRSKRGCKGGRGGRGGREAESAGRLRALTLARSAKVDLSS